jgi:hypothetical protein
VSCAALDVEKNSPAAMKLVKTKKNSTTWLLLRFTCLPLALQGYDHPAPERKRAQGAEYDLTYVADASTVSLALAPVLQIFVEPQFADFRL